MNNQSVQSIQNNNKKKLKFRSNKERVNFFLNFFDKRDKVLILIWADPDSIACAWAIKKILQNRVDKVSIAHINEISRLNNQVMIKILKIPLQKFTPSLKKEYSKFILVDSQPTHREEFKNIKFTAVIDHHPLSNGWEADYIDVRPQYGATATIIFEYMRALKMKPTVHLATALIYAIKTDTENFEKKTDLQDVLAFQKLFRYINKHLLAKIESANLKRSELKYFKIAFNQIKFQRHRIFTYIGKVSNPDVLVLIADFFNKVFDTSWVFVGGSYKKKLIIIIRCDGYRKDAGKLASKAFKNLGLAGGHRDKARAEIPFENLEIPPEKFATKHFISLFKKYFKR